MSERLRFRRRGPLVAAGVLLVNVAAASDRWTAVGPSGGTVSALAVAPDGNVWAGTAIDGVYQSADRGTRWRRARGLVPATQVLGLTVDPANPRALYASFAGFGSVGLYYRQPGGEWTPRGPGFSVDAFTVAPSDPRRLYAASGSSTLVSDDRGLTWQASCCGSLSEVTALQVDLRNRDVVFAATTGGVFRSTDAGQSWQNLAADATTAPIVVHSLALDPGRPEVLFAGTAGSGLWRSRDGGGTWERVQRTGIADVVAALAIDPKDSRRVYAGIVQERASEPPLGQVWRSSDDGTSWARTPQPAAVLSLAIDRVVGTVYAGLEHEGVRASDDGGTTWRGTGRGMQALPVFDIGIDPHAHGRLWVVAPELSPFSGSYAGLFSTANGGKTWARRDAPLGPDAPFLHQIAFDPARPGRLWAIAQRTLLRSDDAGVSWERLDVLLNNAARLTIDPERPDRIYIAGSRQVLVDDSAIDIPVLWRTTDGGVSWTTVEAFNPSLPEEHHRLAVTTVHPRHADTVYGLASTGVYRSRDAGNGWARLSGTPVACANAGFTVTGDASLVVDPFRPGTLYATHCDSSAPVYKSVDGGAHWRPTGLRQASALSFVRALVADPYRPGTLYAAGDEGVVISRNRGATWTPLRDGLPAGARARSLAVDPRWPGAVYVGLENAGLFRLTPTTTTGSSQSPDRRTGKGPG